VEGRGALAPLLALGCDGFRRGLLTWSERGREGARGGGAGLFRGGFGRGPHLSVTKFFVGGSREETDLRGTRNAPRSLHRRL
jgi:hypothetical protein